MSNRPDTPTLDRVSVPADLKALSDDELKRVAHELRAETISAVSETGGHLGAGLGVVELTVALHAVFDAPKDRLIWDVSHQCYPHKILTGRRERIRTLRKKDGLSDSPNARKALTTPSARPIVRPRFRLRSVLRSRVIWAVPQNMESGMQLP